MQENLSKTLARLVSGATDEQLDSMCNGRVIRYTSGFTAFNVGAVWSVVSERIRGAMFMLEKDTSQTFMACYVPQIP